MVMKQCWCTDEKGKPRKITNLFMLLTNEDFSVFEFKYEGA